MTGATLPYHLRPHKSVDRRLFLDLLSRYERWKPLSEFAYISMGAYPLEDHKLIHRMFGITRLLSFDSDSNVVARQKFNKPIYNCHCVCETSSKLIDKLDECLSDACAADASGLVIWLDYTSPKALGQQIREFQSLLDKLRVGDVVRVTVNAAPSSLGDGRNPDGSPKDAIDLRTERFERLKARIGDYFPSNVTQSDMTQERLPSVIARSFGQAAGIALPVSGSTCLAPLSIIRYADGLQMLSMTGAIIERENKDSLRSTLDLAAWPFASSDWGDIKFLSVPDLTLRERMFLERAVLWSTTEDIASELGFEFDGDFSMADFLRDYKSYYRFYPSLLSAET